MSRRLTSCFLGILVILTGMLPAVWAQRNVLAAPHEAPSPEQQVRAVEDGVFWLMQGQQNDDGGFGVDFSTGKPASTASTTLDAVLAIAAAGYSPAAVYPGQQASAIAYLLAEVGSLQSYAAQSGGGAGKIVQALVAANQDPRAFGGQDWVALLQDGYDSGGTYNTQDPYNQSLALQALAAVNEPAPPVAIMWLKDQQAVNGSWSDGFGTDSNSDATAMAVMALLAQDVPLADPVLQSALDFLAATQLESGGWEYGAGFGENANSTALVVQALAAAGEDFVSESSPWSSSGRSPLAALLTWQSASGAFQADFGQGPADNLFATLQAIPGTTGRPFPLPGRFEASQRALVCLAGLQDPASGGWEQFAGFGVNAGGTARAIEAIRAAGGDPHSPAWQPAGTSAVEALETLVPTYVAGSRGGRAGIVTQGVAAAGDPYSPTDFAGVDLPQLIAGSLDSDGAYDDTSFGYSAHAEAMLGLLAAGKVVDDTAVVLLRKGQQGGDWGSPDGTGIALNVLGRLGIFMPDAVAGLRDNQQEDAGWGYGVPADPSATSEIVQGLVQSGENPFGPRWSKVLEGRLTNPADTIMGQQQDNGCWPNRFGPGDDPFGTTDAMVLLAQQPYWRFYRVSLPVLLGP